MFARRIARSLAAHPPASLRFALRAWLAAPAVEASLRVLGFKTTLAAIDRLPPMNRSALAVDDAERAVGLAFRAHPLLRGQCLERALVQYALHRRDGTPARFLVGVRRDDGFEAHAWIEPQGPHAARSFEPLLVREIPS